MPDAAASRKRQILGVRNARRSSVPACIQAARPRYHQAWTGLSAVDELQRASNARRKRKLRRHTTTFVAPTGPLAISRAPPRSSDLLDGEARQDSIHLAIARVPGRALKCILCPENKDYCDPATRLAARFQSRRNSSAVDHLACSNRSGKRLFHRSESAFFRNHQRNYQCGGIGASIVRFGVRGVSRRGKTGATSASAVILAKNGTNRKRQCRTMTCGESSIAAACYLCNTFPKTP
jgi:hypothetical protein